MLIADPVSAFAGAIAKDIGAHVAPIPDGIIHRFDDPKGRRHNQAGWYVLHLNGCPAGAYGNWRTGLEVTWNGRSDRAVTAEERERHRVMVRQATEQREHEKAQAQEAAAHIARSTWELALFPHSEHPYLIQKRIRGNFLRQSRGELLVMLRDIDGYPMNLQRIYPDGSKRFLKGGRVSGCFWLCGNYIPDTGTLYITEGMATAATIAETLGVPVVAAMSAGNLLAVAQAIRAQRPRLALILAADNDHRTPGNPGLTKAAAAACAVQGALTWPTTCSMSDCTCTDYSDTASCGRAPR